MLIFLKTIKGKSQKFRLFSLPIKCLAWDLLLGTLKKCLSIGLLKFNYEKKIRCPMNSDI